MTPHLPVTPALTCGGCGAEWPCRNRQRKLRAEYDRAVVSPLPGRWIPPDPDHDQKVWDEQVRQYKQGHLRNERPKVRIRRLV